MTSADKPRANLVALFDAFAALPTGRASLQFSGNDFGDVLNAWAADHGHHVERKPLYNASLGAWTMLEVRLAGGTVSVHLDSVQEQPEAAEGSV